jgi:hypothetical protein
VSKCKTHTPYASKLDRRGTGNCDSNGPSAGSDARVPPTLEVFFRAEELGRKQRIYASRFIFVPKKSGIATKRKSVPMK